MGVYLNGAFNATRPFILDKTTEENFMPHSKSREDVRLYGTYITKLLNNFSAH